MMNNTKRVPLPLNGANESELFRPTVNHQLIYQGTDQSNQGLGPGPGVDTPLVLAICM